MNALGADDRARLAELSPLLRRCVGLDAGSVARLRLDADTTSVFVRLPFAVLAARTIASDAGVDTAAQTSSKDTSSRDITVAASQTLEWLDGTRAVAPENRDADWRGGVPPRTGWRRLDTVPEDVIRGLVRSGARTLDEAAAREGVPGAQPRAEVADALLDSTVLTVDDAAGSPVQVPLRALSALTRMGFLPRGGGAAIDVAGRWVRIAGGYGSVYTERPGAGLTLR